MVICGDMWNRVIESKLLMVWCKLGLGKGEMVW